jgi:hypothetical protein
MTQVGSSACGQANAAENTHGIGFLADETSGHLV